VYSERHAVARLKGEVIVAGTNYNIETRDCRIQEVVEIKSPDSHRDDSDAIIQGTKTP
jgi:hypothetical protein